MRQAAWRMPFCSRRPARSKSQSWCHLPTSCSPIGRPSSVQPQFKLRAGWPVMVNSVGAQAARISPAGRPSISISPEPGCVARSGGHVSVGVTRMSKRSNQDWIRLNKRVRPCTAACKLRADGVSACAMPVAITESSRGKSVGLRDWTDSIASAAPTSASWRVFTASNQRALHGRRQPRMAMRAAVWRSEVQVESPPHRRRHCCRSKSVQMRRTPLIRAPAACIDYQYICIDIMAPWGLLCQTKVVRKKGQLGDG
jgi:hypothetical protein